jgi:hypothetical protein
MSLTMAISASAEVLMMRANSVCSAVERGIEQQVGHADHAVERGADLVAHGGQEIAS